jgi:hypothetical protein
MKKIVKIFNNFIKRTIFKLENKTNDKFHVSDFNKFIIIIIGILFIYIFYLLTPLLYDKKWVQNKIASKLSTEFNITFSNSLDISYRILPKPHFLIKDTKTSLAKIKNLKIFISQNNFFNKDAIKINEVIIEKANFSLSNDNFNMLYKNSNDKFPKKRIKILNSNIFFKNTINEIISIVKISSAFLFFDEKNLFNLFDLKGEIFNIPFQLKYRNILDTEKKIEIKAPDLKLKVINKIFKINENTSNGINNILILNSSINTRYNTKDQIIIFQSDISRVSNSKMNYTGQLSINPFDLNLIVDVTDYKISNLLKLNSIIDEFIRSGLLFNENISVRTLINIKSKIKNEIFHDAKIVIKILNGRINFDNSVFINNDIGLLEITNSNLFLENNKLILKTDISIDIKDTDKLFSFLKTSKKSRKDIKDIKLSIIYDFLGNQIEFKSIKIDNNEVSNEFQNKVEGFIDNNSINLINSRRLLNGLINLYEG